MIARLRALISLTGVVTCVAACMATPGTHSAAAAVYDYATTAGSTALAYNHTITPDSSVALEILFAQPLPASSYLVFVDFDAREVLTIKAYDQGIHTSDQGRTCR